VDGLLHQVLDVRKPGLARLWSGGAELCVEVTNHPSSLPCLRSFSHPQLAVDPDDTSPGPLQQFQAAILDFITLCQVGRCLSSHTTTPTHGRPKPACELARASALRPPPPPPSLCVPRCTASQDKYDELFEPFFRDFVTHVWTLLAETDPAVVGLPAFDAVVLKGMRFLTACIKQTTHTDFFGVSGPAGDVGGRGRGWEYATSKHAASHSASTPHAAGVQSEAVLSSLCERVVVPNITMRLSEAETFTDAAIEFIRQDIEGSDSDTRRRAASDMVRGLCRNFEGPVSKMPGTRARGAPPPFSPSPHVRAAHRLRRPPRHCWATLMRN